MSWQANEAVRRFSMQKGSARLLLIMLSNYANPDGSRCYPSIASLCADTRLSEREVRLLLRQIEADGELVIEYQRGPKRTNIYWFNLPEGGFTPPAEILAQAQGAKIAPSEGADEGAKAVAEGGKIPAKRGQKTARRGQTVAPDPSVNPSEDPPTVDPSLNAPVGASVRAREVRPVLRPREVLLAEQADCPVWAAFVALAGQPTGGVERERWTAAWRDLLATGEDRAALAAQVPIRAAVYRRRFTVPFSIPALVGNWGALAEPVAAAAPLAPPADPDWRAARTAESARAVADRATLLAQLGTDSRAQVWWQEQASRAPRLRDCWRAAIFVPPEPGRQAALVFTDPAQYEAARGSPGEATKARQRIRARYQGLAGEVPLLALGATGAAERAVQHGGVGDPGAGAPADHGG